MGQAGQQRTRQKKLSGGNKKVPSVKKTIAKPCKLKKQIVPGSVLILLAGKFRGRRVVFLKQLDSGLLLVTGPYCLNGVPLKRVNQRYCIGTSTKVELGGADFKSVSDKDFAREKSKKGPKTQEHFFATEPPKKELPQAKKDAQKKLDESIVKGLGDDLKSYLKSRFSLSAQMYPHELKF
ncbi:unnamed protein product [Effrenium voratum]|uniref:60S ribosomal protein L6 n=1 Tax=Effrenium voratum TaxID=2562239 RepID=A0AA36IRT6_9DINO|nr:unnamed protein product [Effrenium voratum]CAJ1392341.1 unnamed protein product [Effrenium voratum]